MYHPEDSMFSLTNSKNNGGCHFTKKVQKSPLYLSYILIQERLGILAARCALYITYSIRFEKNDILRQYNDKIIMYSDRFRYHLIISETWKKVQHSENDIRISHNLLSPSPSLLKNYCIHSFWSQNTEKRNNTISQMRLRSVFKMRMSILNTATTEQMGYGSISFFVCFPLMNQIVV